MGNYPRNDLNNNYTIQFALLEAFKNRYSKTFTYIDLPYVIEDKYINVTLPSHIESLKHNSHMSYVGSAEQSFIKYMSEGLLLERNYQSITICSRDEKETSEFNLMNFIKLELFSTNQSPLEIANIVLEEYRNFDNREYSLISTNYDNYDIVCNDIELGSYGWRYNPFTSSYFTYGTGLALPRFTSQ